MEKNIVVKNTVMILIVLLPLVLLFPYVNGAPKSKDKSPKIVYVIPGDGLDAKTVNNMVKSVHPLELDNFLKAKGFANGKNDPMFQSMLNKGKASLLMEDYIITKHRFDIKQITGINPSMEVVKISDEDSLKGIQSLVFATQFLEPKKITEDIINQIRQNSLKGLNALRKNGVTLDPGKDKVVYIAEEIDGYSMPGSFATIYGGATIGGVHLDPSDLTGPTVVHELIHAGLVDGKFYCDAYSYLDWASNNKLALALSRGKWGCANEYDPLRCCSDNPEWWKEGSEIGQFNPKNPVNFKKKEYENHLKKIGLGPNCIPSKCWKDEDCIYKCRPLNNYLEGFTSNCVGNPCQGSNQYPPYYRDIMAGSYGEGYEECFGDDGVKPCLPKKYYSPTK